MSAVSRPSHVDQQRGDRGADARADASQSIWSTPKTRAMHLVRDRALDEGEAGDVDQGVADAQEPEHDQREAGCRPEPEGDQRDAPEHDSDHERRAEAPGAGE